MKALEIGDGVYCLPGACNIGIIVGDRGEALLVDTGLDASSGRRAVKATEEMGARVVAIINTHAHADHVGGDAEVKRRTACSVLAPRFEACWLDEPLLEPFSLFNAAYPPSSMRNKFVMAEGCAVDRVIEPGDIEVAGTRLRIVDLKGHSPHQIGVLCRGCLFSGDAFFKAEQLEKHVIPYNADIGSHLETLRRLPEIGARVVVPGHGGVADDPEGSIRMNLERIEMISQEILECLRNPLTIEGVTEHLCRTMGVEPVSVAHHYLIVSAVSAYLSYLSDAGLVGHEASRGRLVWRRTGDAMGRG